MRAQHKNHENFNVRQRERRNDAVMAIGIALGLLVSVVIVLTGDPAIWPPRLWLASSAAGVLVTGIIIAIGFRCVNRLHRQGR